MSSRDGEADAVAERVIEAAHRAIEKTPQHQYGAAFGVPQTSRYGHDRAIARAATVGALRAVSREIHDLYDTEQHAQARVMSRLANRVDQMASDVEKKPIWHVTSRGRVEDEALPDEALRNLHRVQSDIDTAFNRVRYPNGRSSDEG